MNDHTMTLLVCIARSHYDYNALAYHNWTHVRDLLAVGAMVEGELHLATILAILFHDAVYDPHDPPGYNEAYSVELLGNAIAACPGPVGQDEPAIDEARRMIHATAHHMDEDLPATLLATEATLRFMDLDMTVLAKSWDEFLDYRKAIRKEHSGLSLAKWKEGSAAFCRTLLEREYIYRTRPYRVRFEEMARQNLKEYLLSLEP